MRHTFVLSERTLRLAVFCLAPACSLLAPTDSELQRGDGSRGGASPANGGHFGGDGETLGGRAVDAGAGMGGTTGEGGDERGDAGTGHVGEGGAIDGGAAGDAGRAGEAGTQNGAGGTLAAGGAPTSGGSVAAGGTLGAGGKVAGSGGTTSACAANPCVRGTCSDVSGGYKCTCPAGWGGTRCATSSCNNMTCPAAAPCKATDPDLAAVCYPSACGTELGLCIAENADGTGAAVVFDGRNDTFAFKESNWNNRAKYFGYLYRAHGPYVCVYPNLMNAGTSFVIQLGTVRTKSAGFGQSNAWPLEGLCESP